MVDLQNRAWLLRGDEADEEQEAAQGVLSEVWQLLLHNDDADEFPHQQSMDDDPTPQSSHEPTPQSMADGLIAKTRPRTSTNEKTM